MSRSDRMEVNKTILSFLQVSRSEHCTRKRKIKDEYSRIKGIRGHFYKFSFRLAKMLESRVGGGKKKKRNWDERNALYHRGKKGRGVVKGGGWCRGPIVVSNVMKWREGDESCGGKERNDRKGRGCFLMT